MGPWRGLLNAYANTILYIFNLYKNHAALRVKQGLHFSTLAIKLLTAVESYFKP